MYLFVELAQMCKNGISLPITAISKKLLISWGSL